MMERWYIGFITRGSPSDLTTQLGRLVRQYSLGDFIARACYEKRSNHKNHGEYYFFMGVVSEQKGVLPDDLFRPFSVLLNQLNLHDIGAYVYYDEIQSWVSKEIEAFNFRQIKMPQTSICRPSDPFHYTGLTSDNHQGIESNPAFNHLLYWLSSYGRGTWQQFRTTCMELGIDPSGEHARRFARQLRSLGHIEMTNNGQNWFVAPACLVQVETMDQQYHTFLSGQRSPHLIEALQTEASVIIEPHPNRTGPEIVRAVFINEAAALSFAENYSQQNHYLRTVGLASWKIATKLPNLTEWEAQLSELPIVTGKYTYQQWINGHLEIVPMPNETGLYQLTHVNERVPYSQMTLFYDAENKVWRKADWYGLHYLMLRRTGVTCEAHYDNERRELAIALEQRWPDVYERALVLASGVLPIVQNNYAIFRNISEMLAHMLVNLVGAEFIEYKGI